MYSKLLFLMLLIPAIFSQAQVPTMERDALIALYNSTNGDNWTQNTNWNTTEPVSSWHGISVENISGQDHVTEISLNSNNLTGPLPNEIGDFTELHVLEFSINYLSGEIPESIGDLLNLNVFSVWQNNMTGNLPIALGNCTSLQSLSFEDNYFTGSIPESYSNLTLLQSFWVNGNNLSGDIPDFIDAWSDLIYFSLGANSEFNYHSGNRNAFTGNVDLSQNSDIILVWMSDTDIETIDLRNGNNTSMINVTLVENPFLSCVFVEDVTWSEENWDLVDETISFVESEAACEALHSNDELLTQPLRIYPNPASNYIYIQNNQQMEIQKITIYNSMGQKILSTKKFDKINISNFKPGVYFVVFLDKKDNKSTYQLIKK